MKFFPKTIYYPRESVVEKYETGALDLVILNLLSFVERHFDEIIVLANESSLETDAALIDATEDLILKRGTTNPASEMADQIREIQNETWYEGEKGNLDSSSAKSNWIEKYALQWREARIYENLIILEKERSKVLAILKEEK